ncbi:MAG: sugar phosphate isomerase/epimerase family protein [Candidatus Methylacidiphilales bacterium]|nr:sugar phosphate isomerase/epimerase family protein [Candidatus Methylacidiphilales bacterium]
MSLDIPFIEVCEAKLDPARADDQLRMLKDSGLSVSSVQPRLHSLFPDQPRPQPADPRDRIQLLRQSMELFGRHFPGVTLVTITGAAPAGNYAEAYRVAIREYSEAARIAADCGVRLAVEPLNPILMNIDTFICSLAHADRIVEAVGLKSFGMFVDVWHIWEDTAVPLLIQKYGNSIFGVHINDWRDPRAIGDRYLPGEGQIPLVPLLQAIRATGYSGAYTLEIFSDPQLPDSLWLNPEDTARRGRDAFAKVWESVCA